MSKSIEQTINQLKVLNEKINKQKEELTMNIQKVFTELRTALNQREDQLLLKIEELFTKNFFGEEMIRESEKLPGTIKKCLDSGDMIRDKWNKENELSEAINYYVVFRNNINQIDEINQKINKCNSNKVRIFFENNKKGLEETVKKFGNLIEKEEGKEKEKEKKVLLLIQIKVINQKIIVGDLVFLLWAQNIPINQNLMMMIEITKYNIIQINFVYL